ncbi:MAG: esterase [Prevotella sp.]|nr:esterase [Prevotella sp.]
MKKRILSAAAIFVCIAAFAQQSPWADAPIASPVINVGGTVTFRIFAPDCTSVQLTGDLFPEEKIQTPAGETADARVVDMTRGGNGVWEYTTPEPLAPELYTYHFIVDGVKVDDPANVYIVRNVAETYSYFIIGGGRADLYKVNAVPHGTLSRVWYDSPTLGMSRRMAVYTPAGYDENGDTRYPVFYLLHGMGGDEEAWPALGRAAQILDNLIAQGKAEPMIVVMPNGNISQEAAPGEGSVGLVVPSSERSTAMEGSFETAFPDIVNYVDSHYRTIADKHHRAIAGLSMGGFHSLHISKYFPDMFDYVGLFSAAITPFDGVRSPVYEDFEGRLRIQFEKKPALYWIGIGNDDFLYEANKEYRSLLDKGGYPYTYFESDGGHIWRNWRLYLSEFAPLLFK